MASTTTHSPDDAPAPPAASDEPHRLAPADAPGDEHADAEEVLVVQVGARTYALPAAQVREVARAAPVTPLPGAAPWIVGLAAVRGALLPVGDLRRCGDDAARADEPLPERDAWMAVIDDGRRGAALLGLRVRGVALARRFAAGEADAATRDAAGLPVRGDARLMDDGRRSAGAASVRLARRTRASAPASRAPAAGDVTEMAERSAVVARLDVTALLDDLYEEGG